MRILFVSAYVPSRIRVRPYNFIKALARRGHAITLFCGAGRDDTAALAELRTLCARVVALPVGRQHLAWNTLRALPSEIPLQAALAFGPPLLNALQAEVRRGAPDGQPYDVAHVEHLRAAALGVALQRLPAILDTVDSISLLFERAWRAGSTTPLKSRLLALLDLARTRRYEAHYPDRYDHLLVSSPEDAWALEALAQQFGGAAQRQQMHQHLTVVANGVDLRYFAPQPIERAPAELVFSGKMSYHANIAAALFLGQAIMPQVWQQRPDVTLVIAGSSPPREVQALASDKRVTVTGYVEDLRPYVARATLAVAPLRYGVGIQNKVLEGMAMGTPVVAARQVARSIHASDGTELLLATSAEEYAVAISTLLADAGRREAIGAAGRQYVERHHDWDAAAARIEEIYRYSA